LIQQQINRLFSLVGHPDDPNYPSQQQQIGSTHHHWKIDPVWIMGAYHLYQQHLQDIVQHATDIAETDRVPLAKALNKLLFRDMGLMLDG